MLYRLVDDLAVRRWPSRTVFYLMAFPFAFFLVRRRTTSPLFLVLQRWRRCTACGAATGGSAGLLGRRWPARPGRPASCSRIAFAVEYLRQRDWQPSRDPVGRLAVALVPTGMLAYMRSTCWQAFGDPLKFVHVQVVLGPGADLALDGHGQGHRARSTRPSVDGYIFQPLVVLNVIDVLVGAS